jgi:phosphate transport system protein
MANATPSMNDPELSALEIELAQLAGAVEAQIGDAIAALERRDIAAAERVVAQDRKIDAAHRAIDARAIRLLAKGGLSQKALREVVMAMRMAAELERVGDLAKNVAKRSVIVSHGATSMGPVTGIVRMGKASLRQFSDVLTAYGDENTSAATAVWTGDDDLDELYDSVFEDIVAAMANDRAQIRDGAHLVLIAKTFERIGDHATNLAEAAHYLFTGEQLPDERPKGRGAAD